MTPTPPLAGKSNTSIGTALLVLLLVVLVLSAWAGGTCW